MRKQLHGKLGKNVQKYTQIKKTKAGNLCGIATCHFFKAKYLLVLRVFA